MCGFTGVAWRGGTPPGDLAARVSRMAHSIAHRGPDSDGLISDEAFCRVAFKRLAIVDLTTGDQPVSSEDGTVDVLLNGEIYNHRQLRRELEEKGHRFRTQSDTEIIPHLYQEYGPDFVTRLNGMFAICVVDHTRRRLFLYRDRIGIKPMFLAERGGALVFGSELKTLLVSGLVEPEVDESRLVTFLANFAAPGERSLVAGVDQLLPGEMLQFDADGQVGRRRWYTVPVTAAADAVPLDLDELDSLLTDAVSLRLMADVPIGISLSGGLDSSLITMYAARADHTDLNLFTVHFEGTPTAELDCAKEVAAHFGINHETLTTSTDTFVAEAPATFWMCDEPVADPAYFPATKVAEAASGLVKVLLSGTGADELFAGYGHHALTSKKRWLTRLPDPLLGSPLLTPLLRRALRPEEVEPLRSYRSSRLAWHMLAQSSLDAASESALRAHLGTVESPDAALAAAYRRAASADPLTRQLLADTETYLPDQLLPVLDRSTMGASIEGRVPFLDHRVVEFAMRTRGADKLGGATVRKAALRSLARGNLPDTVLDRAKLGFPNAVVSWLDGRLGELVPQIFTAPDSLVDRHLPRDWVASLVSSPEAMKRHWRLVYGLLALQVWDRVLLHDPREERPTESLDELFHVAPSR